MVLPNPDLNIMPQAPESPTALHQILNIKPNSITSRESPERTTEIRVTNSGDEISFSKASKLQGGDGMRAPQDATLAAVDHAIRMIVPGNDKLNRHLLPIVIPDGSSRRIRLMQIDTESLIQLRRLNQEAKQYKNKDNDNRPLTSLEAIANINPDPITIADLLPNNFQIYGADFTRADGVNIGINQDNGKIQLQYNIHRSLQYEGGGKNIASYDIARMKTAIDNHMPVQQAIHDLDNPREPDVLLQYPHVDEQGHTKAISLVRVTSDQFSSLQKLVTPPDAGQ
jgi:hypothetical protein